MITIILASVVLAADPPAVVDCATAPVGTACVPGGPMIRGVDADAGLCGDTSGSWPCATKAAAPKDTVWVQTFYMDIHEVTYANYKQCVTDGKCPQGGPSYGDFNRPTQPISGVSWYMATAYCKAHGEHLPTEAEWEKAARGPDGELNPWGNAVATCETAIIMDEKGRSCGTPKAGSHPEKGRVIEIGSRPAGRYGLYDMVGNVQEWVNDWYTSSYKACGEACKGVDPKGPCGGKEPCEGYDHRVVKGGSWYWGPEHANGADRRAHIPSNNPIFHHFGFRCAASVEEAAKLTAAK